MSYLKKALLGLYLITTMFYARLNLLPNLSTYDPSLPRMSLDRQSYLIMLLVGGNKYIVKLVEMRKS